MSSSTPAGEAIQSSTTNKEKTTVVAFAITVVFFISFASFPILIFINAATPDNLGRSLRGSELVAFNIFQRFPLLNAVANPFIYGYFNKAFRAECVKIWRKFTFRKTGSTWYA
jgi:hypothetical protein